MEGAPKNPRKSKQATSNSTGTGAVQAAFNIQTWLENAFSITRPSETEIADRAAQAATNVPAILSGSQIWNIGDLVEAKYVQPNAF